MFSCGSKAFPDERFNFSPMYRNLVSPYRIGDTLHFTNENRGIRRIRITGTDSIVSNWKGGFMSQRPYKVIQVYCDALDFHRKNARDTDFVLINKYPDSLKQSCHFSVMNFRGQIGDGPDSIISEFHPTGGKIFSNCFVIRNVASDLVEGDDDIEYIFVQQASGVIAFKSYRGDLWVKQ
jgi:hypothetical protein